MKYLDAEGFLPVIGGDDGPSLKESPLLSGKLISAHATSDKSGETLIYCSTCHLFTLLLGRKPEPREDALDGDEESAEGESVLIPGHQE